MGMTITESIQKAMAELGVPNGEISLEGTGTAKKAEKKSSAKPKKEPIVEKKEPKEPFMNPPVEEPLQEEESTEENLSVFCKIKDGKMVLFFPKDYPFEVTNFGDLALNTLTFEMPDCDNHKLQELSIILPAQKAPAEEVIRKPIILPKEDKKPEKAEKRTARKVELSDDEDMNALLQEKADLDEQIREARHNGDEELVNQLRKERRIVRGKINKLRAGE